VTLKDPLAADMVAGDDVTSIRYLASGQSDVDALAEATLADASKGAALTLKDDPPFQIGDRIVDNTGQHGGTIVAINGKVLTVDATWAAQPNFVRLADLGPNDFTTRLESATGISPGSVLLIESENPAAAEYALVSNVKGALVTLSPAVPRKASFSSAAGAVRVTPQELRLVVTPPEGGKVERFDNRSLEPSHPGYIFGGLNSAYVSVEPAPAAPPLRYPNGLIRTVDPPLADGADDQPLLLTSDNYSSGLAALADVKGPSIVCVPDASSHRNADVIQEAIIDHCVSLQDRFAVLDSRPQLQPLGATASVQEQLTNVHADSGFAALYYPWLTRWTPATRVRRR
jgi:hypothetical protein